MASPVMENSENVEEVSEVQEVQGNKSWDDAMDEVEHIMQMSKNLKKDDAQWS